MGPVDAKSRQLSVLEPLSLQHLPAEGLVYDQALPAAWLSTTLGKTTDTGEPLTILGDGHAELTVTPLGDVDARPPILVRGRVTGRVRTACVRCLDDVDLDVGDTIETTLFPAPAAAAESTDGDKGDRTKGGKKARDAKSRRNNPKDATVEDWTDAPPTDLDAELYRGELVALPTVLADAFVLSLDLNPTCADEDACDVRTRALIDEANRPAQAMETEPDPRWAALKDLVAEDPERSG